MKTLLRTLYVVFVIGMVGTATAAVVEQTACSPAANRAVVKTVVDVLLAECVSQHTEIEKVEELQQACEFADDMKPVVEKLLTARKLGTQKVLYSSKGKDGGV